MSRRGTLFSRIGPNGLVKLRDLNVRACGRHAKPSDKGGDRTSGDTKSLQCKSVYLGQSHPGTVT